MPASSNSSRRALAGLMAAALLTLMGCVSQPREAVKANQKQLYAMDSWAAEGKLGLRVNGKANSASFSWLNDGQDYLLRLHGPFGQGGISLQMQNGWVTLESKEHRDTARSPELLMEEALGWTLPISELVYWIKGLPSPESPIRATRENAAGNLEILEQQGWHISYSDYRLEDGAVLPRRIIAQRDDIRLVLAIKRWQVEL